MMVVDFDVAVDYILRNEGGLSINPNDKGGVTNYGISLRFLKSISSDTLKKYGIFVGDKIDEEEIKNLTITQAKAIYKGEFWDHASFDKLTNQSIANYLFDMAVNMGISPAVKCIQRACWSIMKDRKKICDDGILGQQTLDAIHQCTFYLLPVMRSERAGFYRLLAELHPEQKEFLEGWLNRAYEQK